jgi:hypothetical protein
LQPSRLSHNLVEVLAAELIAKHLPLRFEAVGDTPRHDFRDAEQ